MNERHTRKKETVREGMEITIGREGGRRERERHTQIERERETERDRERGRERQRETHREG